MGVQAASLLLLLGERCGEELAARLTARDGPAAGASAVPGFAQGLAAQLAAPDAKALKVFLQQALRDARAAGTVPQNRQQ